MVIEGNSILSVEYKLCSNLIKSFRSLQAVETGKETINSWNTDKLSPQ